MGQRRDDDTAPLVPPGVNEQAGGTPGRPHAPAVRRRGEDRGDEPPGEHRMPWPIYEFATPEAALLYVAHVQALGRVRGWWPALGLERDRVRVDLGPLSLEGGSGSVRASAAALHAAALDLGARPGTRPSRGGGAREPSAAQRCIRDQGVI